MAARWCAPLALLGALALGAMTPARAQAQATVQGRVVSETGEPIVEARVLVTGTMISAVTSQDGRYALHGVPAGQHPVRVLRFGFKEGRKPVTVADGATATLDFVLEKSVVQLTEIVSTATGARPREELGNSVATVNAASVTQESAVSNLSDVLAARVPGVTVQTGSQTGAGARIRIRGNSSLNLANDPIYVIDGIRLSSNAGNTALFTGGATPNRVNDLNPEEIENIEIVKGPSAATLYGTDAANGVVVITTKRGRAGSTRWNAYAEGGLIKDYSKYPLNYTIAGHSPATPTTYRECTLSVIASGTCVMDSVRTYSPLHDSDASPVGTGNRQQLGLSASGGSESMRYFLSAEKEDETSVLTLPPFERRRFAAQGLQIRPEVDHPNALEKYSSRANLNISPLPNLDISFSSGLISSNTRFVTESNATAGLGSQIFGGKGYKDNGNVSGLEAGVATSPLNGYRAWTPGYTFQETNRQKVTRIITSASADWRPYAWMQNRATVGVDYANRMDYNLCRRGDCPPVSSTYRLGFAEDNRTALRNLTTDITSSGTWQATSNQQLRSTVGVQYVNYYFDQNDATGGQIAPGTQTPNSGSQLSVATNTTLSKTLGYFVEEQWGWKDHLFVTGALRSDQNSAFGTKFQNVYYPKLSASWILSSEEWFPAVSWLDQLRLRGAYGQSGRQPGPNDALFSYNGVLTSYRGTETPGIIYNTVGNLNLRPEKTAEAEFGTDIRMLGRTNLELTYYSKITEDALISAIIAPSAGAANSKLRNLGSVKNAGFEALFSAQLVEMPQFGFDVTLTGSLNDNKLVKMGKDETGRELPPVINVTNRAQAGYPLFGFWATPILGWKDKDGNGILTYNADTTLNEVFVGKDTIFRGYSSPRYTATLVPGVDVLKKQFRVTSLFEYKGGNLYYNNTERIRCASRNNCNGLMNPKASFQEQAMAVAHLVNPLKTLDGFFQPGSFVRWRELGVTYFVPKSITDKYIRSRSASLNFAARNLHLWTKYRGLDPEIDRLAGDSSNAPPEEFQTMGTPTYFVLRLNVGF